MIGTPLSCKARRVELPTCSADQLMLLQLFYFHGHKSGLFLMGFFFFLNLLAPVIYSMFCYTDRQKETSSQVSIQAQAIMLALERNDTALFLCCIYCRRIQEGVFKAFSLHLGNTSSQQLLSLSNLWVEIEVIVSIVISSIVKRFGGHF